MEEIKTVIEKLKNKVDSLKASNEADLNSVQEKRNTISSLEKEIENLNNEVEARNTDIAKLEQKMSEAEDFNASLDEVAPLVDKEEPQQDVNVEAEATASMDEFTNRLDNQVEEGVNENAFAVPEDIKADTFNPFGDVTAEEPAQAPFEFKDTMADFAVPNNEEEPAALEPVAEEPVVEEPKEEEVVDATVMPTEPGFPVINADGFDISAQVNPDFGMNEAYNQDQMIR